MGGSWTLSGQDGRGGSSWMSAKTHIHSHTCRPNLCVTIQMRLSQRSARPSHNSILARFHLSCVRARALARARAPNSGPAEIARKKSELHHCRSAKRPLDPRAGRSLRQVGGGAPVVCVHLCRLTVSKWLTGCNSRAIPLADMI